MAMASARQWRRSTGRTRWRPQSCFAASPGPRPIKRPETCSLATVIVDRLPLGFDAPRQAPTRGNSLNFRTPGVPSDAAMSKYRTDIGDERRAKLWGRFLARLREDWTAEAGREARIAHLDGFNMPIEGVCPKMDRKTGEVVNADLITVSAATSPGSTTARRAATASTTSWSGMTWRAGRASCCAHACIRERDSRARPQ